MTDALLVLRLEEFYAANKGALTPAIVVNGAERKPMWRPVFPVVPAQQNESSPFEKEG
jgi:hypothetical protein